jgi:probable rRNA maturation factor
MKNIRILIKADHRCPVDRKRIRQRAEKILMEKGLRKDVELSISFVGDRKMKQLNSRFRRKKETTDVLSFSLLEERNLEKEDLGEKASFPSSDILRLGDIVISYPQARKQAGQFNILVDEEIDKLVEHGLLHLLGIHHD